MTGRTGTSCPRLRSMTDASRAARPDNVPLGVATIVGTVFALSLGDALIKALGFVGILLVLRPGTEAFGPAALLPLLSAVLYALAMILTRTRCAHEHPATLALVLNATFVLVGAAGLFVGAVSPLDAAGFLSPGWTPMGGPEWRSVALLAALILVASVGTAIAYQAAPASTVGTFDFAYVGFALLWGALFFGERPDAPALLGIVVIVLAGVLAVRRSAGDARPSETRT